MSYLWLLPLLLIGALAIAERRSRRLLAGLGRREGNLRRLLDDFLSLLAVCSLLLALNASEPGRIEKQKKLSLALAVDVSTSMAAETDGISRLDEIRGQLLDFISTLPPADLALVPFSGEAVVQVPLTGDRDAFSYFLRHLQTGQIAVPGSAPEEAARLAQEVVAGKKGGKYVILVSDGERTLPTDPPALGTSVPIYVWPVGGNEPAPVPDRNGNPRYDETGQRLLTQPDPERLRFIAKASGGEILNPKNPGEGFRFSAVEESLKSKTWDRRHWYLLLAVVALLLRHLPRCIRPLRRLAPQCILCISLILGCQPSTENHGRRLFDEAMTSEEAPSARAALFQKAASHLRSSERAVALFNAGTMQLAAKDAYNAVRSFELALLLEPQRPESRHNLALALRLLEQQSDQPENHGGDTKSPQPDDSGDLAIPAAVRLSESISPAPFIPGDPGKNRVQEIPLEKDW